MLVRKMKKFLIGSAFLVVWLVSVLVIRQYPSKGTLLFSQTLEEPYVPSRNVSELEAMQQTRKAYLTRVCEMLQSETTLPSIVANMESLDHFIVDDEHRMLYCYVPKVACTNWKRVLMVLMGKANSSDPLSIVADDAHRQHVFKKLSDYSPSEAATRLESYFKFMFVRHPFERLVSAYRNKFYQNYSSSEYFRSRYGRLIVKTYRENPSEESLNRGHDVTFAEFAQYLIDPRTQRLGLNEHWKAMHELCHPCQVKYDVVGKYETLSDDAWYVLNRVQQDSKHSFPRADKRSSSEELLAYYMATLSREQLLHLYHIYELDFRLFDYHYHGLGEEEES